MSSAVCPKRKQLGQGLGLAPHPSHSTLQGDRVHAAENVLHRKPWHERASGEAQLFLEQTPDLARPPPG